MTMHDLLTKKERDAVVNAEKTLRADTHHKNTYQDAGLDLLAIIDNLSERGVKKYSERELHLAFQKQIGYRDWVANDGRLGMQYDEWLKCARFLGALKEPNA